MPHRPMHHKRNQVNTCLNNRWEPVYNLQVHRLESRHLDQQDLRVEDNRKQMDQETKEMTFQRWEGDKEEVPDL